MSTKTWKRNVEKETRLWKMLVERFGDVYVHAQRPFRNYSGRFDFYIFGRDYNFGIDIFYPDTLHSFAGCINIKQQTYQKVVDKIYLVSMNMEINQNSIDKVITHKKNILHDNIEAISLEEFLNRIKKIPPRI